MKGADVVVRDLWFNYHTPQGETPALAGLSLRVPAGEFVGIVGPSGCGKSTLFSLIAGLLRPERGEVLIDGQPVTEPRPDVAYMLQQDCLLEWRTVLDNALLGLEVRGMRTRERVARVRELLARSGLAGFEHRFPRELSGGMRQRTALVRTLALEPRVVLLDEPFSAVDAQTRLLLEEEVGLALRERQATVLLVTHDIGEAVAMCDRVVVLTHRPARVKREYRIALGSSADYSPVAARRSSRFSDYFSAIWADLEVQVKPGAA
ncbi:MAG TPA: ABC transporter ATP-binding protein [Limnochordales bacterium]